MKMNLITRLGLGAAAIAVAAGALAFSGAVSAQTPPAGGTPEASGTPGGGQRARVALDDFLQKLAANLHLTVDQLKDGVKTTELQVVADLAAKGTITQEQAQKLSEKINSSGGIGLRAFARSIGRLHRGDVFAKHLRAGIVASSAKAIGVTPKDLVAELRTGKSIADVAGEHNVALDTVKAQIMSDAKAKLDALVQAKKLDQAREDALLAKLGAALDTVLNKKVTPHTAAPATN